MLFSIKRYDLLDGNSGRLEKDAGMRSHFWLTHLFLSRAFHVVNEHLYRLLIVKGYLTTINLRNALQRAFQSHGLEKENFVGDSFDGVLNMS